MTVPVLTISNRDYGGWTRISVRRGIDRLAGEFELGLTDRWSGQETPSRIRPGDPCSVALDGDLVITGYIDSVLPEYDAGQHTIQVRGRSKTADLIDCSVIRFPAEWRNRKLEQIAADLAKPFGLKVATTTDTGASFRQFSIDQGESPYEAIEELCRFRGILATDTVTGDLVFARGGTARAKTSLILGQNILRCRATITANERFSEVLVKGQQPGGDFIAALSAAQPMGKATDDGIGRYRPRLIVESVSLDAAAATERARHEAAVRFGRSLAATYTVAGWHDIPGSLWRENHLVRVTDPYLGIDQDMLIAGVVWRMDDTGAVAELNVIRPEAYQLLAGVGVKTRKRDFWADLGEQPVIK